MLPRIAVLDDDPLAYQTLTGLLAPRGYHLASHAWVTTAVPFVCHQQPALVILDLHLEYLDAGFDVVRALRDDAVTATIPILLWSTDWDLTCRAAHLAAWEVYTLSKHRAAALVLRAVDRLTAPPA